MTEQPPYQRHSDTSKAAAESAKLTAREMRARVLEYLRSKFPDGATDDEMQQSLGLNPSSQRPRRIEGVKLGLIRDSKMRRPTLSGRPAVVWVAVVVEG
jgi:hypothetical protein